MITDKQYVNLLNVVEEIKDKDLKIPDFSNTKSPTDILNFKESPIGTSRCFHKGADGHFYLINGAWEIKKYDNAISPEVDETGITWNRDSHGVPVNVVVSSKGISIFTNFDNTARVYFMETINGTPELVYQSTSSEPAFWTRDFGIKSYHSGINTIILAGVYGRNQSKKDLILSLDGGQTFTVIKQTKALDTNYNSHWHDVAIDPYSGMLWCSEGDNALNRGVHFSDDLGETWTTVSNQTQPTTIMPFPNRIVFGRDDGKPGLSYFDRPLVNDDYIAITGDNIKVLREYKMNTDGWAYYGQSPIAKGKEAYQSHHAYEGEEPNMVMATGDGGLSWHGVFIGFGGVEDGHDLGALWEIDDEYIYATNRSGHKLLYAKRIKFE